MKLPESARAPLKAVQRFALLTLAIIGAGDVGYMIARYFGYSPPRDDWFFIVVAAILAYLEMRRERRAE